MRLERAAAAALTLHVATRYSPVARLRLLIADVPFRPVTERMLEDELLSVGVLACEPFFEPGALLPSAADLDCRKVALADECVHLRR